MLSKLTFKIFVGYNVKKNGLFNLNLCYRFFSNALGGICPILITFNAKVMQKFIKTNYFNYISYQ